MNYLRKSAISPRTCIYSPALSNYSRPPRTLRSFLPVLDGSANRISSVAGGFPVRESVHKMAGSSRGFWSEVTQSNHETRVQPAPQMATVEPHTAWHGPRYQREREPSHST
ncbi:hypothetical protein, variant [Phialophora macrospora]|uniref:Uncharacterized protein n=1 Tax=Phialophora macrospora TaxID=1851006 RepID=A0A0D2DK19_9EURO|nr:hypothetical protein, variant [Phialophora macrospora]